MKSELVSCIMPTGNRRLFLKLAVSGFLRQDYPNLELLIIDSSNSSNKLELMERPNIKYYHLGKGKTVGESRNFACERAEGNIIVHLDDDDIYADNWVSKIITELRSSSADVCGLSKLTFYDVNTAKYWGYKHPINKKQLAYGATFAYRKSFWQKYRFNDLQAGEDIDFLSRSNAKVSSFDYADGYMGLIHNDNIGMQPFDNPHEKIIVMKWMKNLKGVAFRNSYLGSCKTIQSAKVSCIMPTANRRKFIAAALTNFQLQDYINKELIIIDDGSDKIEDLIGIEDNIKYKKIPRKETIGTKRNIGCKYATGDFIVHWDDDDWYAPNWLSHQVQYLRHTDVDICGLDQIQFYSVLDDKYWMTKNYNSRKLWLSGATLAYRKSFWEKYPFKDIQIGEDDAFVRNPKAKVQAHDYYQGFIALIHPKNTSTKVFQK